MTYTETQTSILDVAQELAQTRGFNAFSYRDIADRVGIRTASIHHHFRTKGDLGTAMTSRYRAHFFEAVDAIVAKDTEGRLRGFAELFLRTIESGRMCLCGTLAIEYETLSEPMQHEVRGFFLDCERWLEGVFAHAQAQGELPEDSSPPAIATTFMATLEGAMMGVRAAGGAERLRTALEQQLRQLFRS